MSVTHCKFCKSKLDCIGCADDGEVGKFCFNVLVCNDCGALVKENVVDRRKPVIWISPTNDVTGNNPDDLLDGGNLVLKNNESFVLQFNDRPEHVLDDDEAKTLAYAIIDHPLHQDITGLRILAHLNEIRIDKPICFGGDAIGLVPLTKEELTVALKETNQL